MDRGAWQATQSMDLIESDMSEQLTLFTSLSCAVRLVDPGFTHVFIRLLGNHIISFIE